MRTFFRIAALYALISCIRILPLQAQQLIDGVVAVVADYTIMQSEIEQQVLQMRGAGIPSSVLKCKLLEQYVQEKLLIDQAKIDSLEVTDSEVEGQLNNRMDHFIQQFGSREELETYFGRTVLEIKEDFRENIRNQILAQRMQHELTKNITITPSEVRAFYNSMPRDSVPYIDAQVEIAQIVAYPPLGEQVIFEVREKLLELRKRIMDGESFETLAILYSEDGSASNGGEIGYSSKTQLDPEYAKAAFSLKANQVSKIVESEFGFHIIQLIDRKDDRVNTRHILIRPKISADARKKAVARLDSITDLINKDSITFEKAAQFFSQDKKSRVNNGLVVNPNSNSSLFEMKELETRDYIVIRDMKIGDVSKPYESSDENKKVMYKMVKLKSRTDPHRANLKQDYVLLQNMALFDKKSKIVNKWVQEKQAETFIHIDTRFAGCDFLKDGWTAVDMKK